MLCMCMCVCTCVCMCGVFVRVYVCVWGGSPDSSQVSVRIWRFSDTGYQLSTYVIVHVYVHVHVVTLPHFVLELFHCIA